MIGYVNVLEGCNTQYVVYEVFGEFFTFAACKRKNFPGPIKKILLSKIRINLRSVTENTGFKQ